MMYSNKQTGAVLVISLVILTVLTLIGVASMSSSTLEMKAAGNAQQRNSAFEAGQSLIDVAASLNDPRNTNDYQNFDPLVKQLMSYAPVGLDIAASSESLWDSCSKEAGNSLEDGKGFSMNRFNVQAIGQTTTGSAKSTQLQGVRFPAAACPDI